MVWSMHCIMWITVWSFMLQDSVLSLLSTKKQLGLLQVVASPTFKPWEARSAGIAANSVVTFCIHTDISAPLTFIDVYKQKEYNIML